VLNPISNEGMRLNRFDPNNGGLRLPDAIAARLTRGRLQTGEQ
jgi:hypothetical protein